MVKYLEQLNNLYGKIDITSFATKSFQDIVDNQNAVLSIFAKTGIAGFKFHLPRKEQVTFNNQITNHYLENLEPAQDHIANEPVKITLEGFQGEYFYPVQKIEAMVANVIPTLSLIPEFLPQISAITKQVKSAKLAYEAATSNYSGTLTQSAIAAATNVNGFEIGGGFSLKEKFNAAATVYQGNFNSVDLFSLFQKLYKFKSAQTRAFFFLESLWKAKMTFSVETTWKRYDNMAILSITPTRDDNADITDFKVVLQQMNRTYSKTMSINAAGRTKEQLQEEANKGTDKGLQVQVI